MASEEMYKDAEIKSTFGNAYDQSKEDEDEAVYGDCVYRHLDQWYLLSSSAKSAKCVALPDSCCFKKHVLRGTLMPADPSTHTPIEVELTNLNYWSLDKSSSQRGIWVETSDGTWYRLLAPHSTKQEELHLPLRAKLSLVSNVIDILIESEFYYHKAHLDRSPREMYERLQSSNGDEPFDWQLFQAYPAFVRQYVSDLTDEMTDKTAFVKGLKEEAAKAKKRRAIKYTPTMFLQSAEAAEQRMQRTPWGAMMENAAPVHLNAALEEEIASAARMLNDDSSDDERATEQAKLVSRDTNAEPDAANSEDEKPKSLKKKSPKKRRLSKTKGGNALVDSDDNDDEEVARPPKRQRSNNSGLFGSSDDDDEDMAEETLPPQDKYSAERMKEALKRAGRLIEPTPTKAESGDWNSVVKRKFHLTTKKKSEQLRVLRKQVTNEGKLLIVEAIRNSCLQKKDEFMRNLFIKVDSTIGASIIEQWRQSSEKQLQELAGRNLQGNWFEDASAYRLLIACIKFVSECSVIDTMKKLRILNKQFSLEWNQTDYLQNTLDFCSAQKGMDELVKACNDTRSHLMSILEPSNVASLPSTADDTQPARDSEARDANPSRDSTAKDSSDAAEKKKKALEEAKKKKDVEARKKRMEAILAKGKSNARVTAAPQVSSNTVNPPQAASLPGSVPASQSGSHLVSQQHPARPSPEQPTSVKPAAQSTARNDDRKSPPKPERQTLTVWEELAGRTEPSRWVEKPPSPPGPRWRNNKTESGSFKVWKPPVITPSSETRGGNSPSPNTSTREATGGMSKPPSSHRHESSTTQSSSRLAQSSSRDDPEEGQLVSEVTTGANSGRPSSTGRQPPVPPARDNQPQSVRREGPSGRNGNGHHDNRSHDSRRHPAPAFGSSLASRGRGRGREQTLPAWKTRDGPQGGGPTFQRNNSDDPRSQPQPVRREEPPYSNGSAPHASRSNGSRNPTRHAAPSFSSNAPPGRGRGRGKDINKPAWMTRNEEALGLTNERPNDPSRPRNDDRGPSGPNANGRDPRHENANNGRGRGRGRDINKPAWMTQRREVPGPTNEGPNDPSRPRNEARGPNANGRDPRHENTNSGRERGNNGGRGRGRGREMNRPAWMTQGK